MVLVSCMFLSQVYSELTGLFMQAARGDTCLRSKVSAYMPFTSEEGFAWWKAWNDNKGMSQEVAKRKYIQMVVKISKGGSLCI